jgi:hypothetical protein
MGGAAAWVDEVCQCLQLSGVSPWLPWNKREQSDALGDPADDQGVAGVYLLAWGRWEEDLEIVYVGATGRARYRLQCLESQVKWGLEHGFAALRDVIECREDHRTMHKVWVRMIRVDEVPLFSSVALSRQQVNAVGARRRQLAALFEAEHWRRFGSRVPGNPETSGVILRDTDRHGRTLRNQASALTLAEAAIRGSAPRQRGAQPA